MERYFFRNGPDWVGEFRSVSATNWEEFKNEVRFASFVMTTRTADWITLHDASRNMFVSLPTTSGTSHWQFGGEATWRVLYQVERIERQFTAAQKATLNGDIAQARAMLDRAISRVVETAIFPTASVQQMRIFVRNIFKINVIDPGNPIDQGFQFANLAANLKLLRDNGFANGFPATVFEPDSTQLFAAWVVGTNDPTVHVHPKYFFLDTSDNRAITLVHERAHTVLQINGHPPDTGFIPINPGDGDPQMSAADAIRNAYCYEWLVAALK